MHRVLLLAAQVQGPRAEGSQGLPGQLRQGRPDGDTGEVGRFEQRLPEARGVAEPLGEQAEAGDSQLVRPASICRPPGR